MNVHTKVTATKMAACAAVGLHYWADHPLPGRVWAVDDNQQAHVVRVYASKDTAVLQKVVIRQVRQWSMCGNRMVDETHTYDVGDAIPFEVTAETQDLFRVAT